MDEFLSVLPPPAPPIPVRVWSDGKPRFKCVVCGSVVNIDKPGLIKCGKCGSEYLTAKFEWNSFLIGLAVGLLIGLIISVAAYYFVLRPYIPVARLASDILTLMYGAAPPEEHIKPTPT